MLFWCGKVKHGFVMICSVLSWYGQVDQGSVRLCYAPVE